MGVWIETCLILAKHLTKFRHTLRGCVDWNKLSAWTAPRNSGSHTLRGCVDWNKLLVKLMPLIWVTPFVGVWIETVTILLSVNCAIVTPFVGVWIETQYDIASKSFTKSHPSWVCGLKPSSLRRKPRCIGHTLRGCVDWNCCLCTYASACWGHTLRGCVDWNIVSQPNGIAFLSHTLRGCVDWNKVLSMIIKLRKVTPFVGVWIETILSTRKQEIKKSHPSWVCGLKHV